MRIEKMDLSEVKLTASFVNNENADKEIYHLRKKVFSDELNWVSPTFNRLEVDEFDKESLHVSITNDENDVLGTVRMVDSENDWMMDKYFSHLVQYKEMIRDESSLEVSRFAVEKTARAIRDQDSASVADLLVRSVIHNGIIKGRTRLYAVVSNIVLRYLKSIGLPCAELGDSVVMPDGVVAVAILIDLTEFIVKGHKNCTRFEWFLQTAVSFIKSLPSNEQTFTMRLTVKAFEKHSRGNFPTEPQAVTTQLKAAY